MGILGQIAVGVVAVGQGWRALVLPGPAAGADGTGAEAVFEAPISLIGAKLHRSAVLLFICSAVLTHFHWFFTLL